jgi:hypothetical protein
MAERRISIEELIAFRDGLRTTGNLRRLLASDIEAIKDLAEARLLALLLSLRTEGDLAGRQALPSPETLLQYLMNALPQAEVKAVESAVRGSAEALEFLLALKDALFRPDVWRNDPQPAVPEPSAREDLGVVKVAMVRGMVRFLRDRPAEEIEHVLRASALIEPQQDLSAVDYFHIPAFLSRAEPSPQERLTDTLNDLERQADQLQEVLRQLSRQLALGAKLGQPPEVPIRAAISRLRVHLKSIDAALPSLGSLASELDAQSAANAIQRELERVRNEAKRRAAAEAAARRDPRLDWPTHLTLNHPDLEIDLRSVSTDPTPVIGITVRQMQGAPATAPEATLVEPGWRFMALAPGPDGTFKAPPPSPGTPTLLLIDTDRTYSIHLEPA